MRKGPLDEYPPEWVLRQVSAQQITGSVEIHGETPVTFHVDAGRVYAAAVGTGDEACDVAMPLDEDEARKQVVALISHVLDVTEGWYYLDPLGHASNRGMWSWEVPSLLLEARSQSHGDRTLGAWRERPVALRESSTGEVVLGDDAWSVVVALSAATSTNALLSTLGWNPGRLRSALDELTRASVLDNGDILPEDPLPTSTQPRPVAVAPSTGGGSGAGGAGVGGSGAGGSGVGGSRFKAPDLPAMPPVRRTSRPPATPQSQPAASSTPAPSSTSGTPTGPGAGASPAPSSGQGSTPPPARPTPAQPAASTPTQPAQPASRPAPTPRPPVSVDRPAPSATPRATPPPDVLLRQAEEAAALSAPWATNPGAGGGAGADGSGGKPASSSGSNASPKDDSGPQAQMPPPRRHVGPLSPPPRQPAEPEPTPQKTSKRDALRRRKSKE
ncbi:MAG: hypothetical protein KDA95_09970 [Acidimicrobiales bacterium]|nr:hypothetical protein [Acidimicrobiales bacterium]